MNDAQQPDGRDNRVPPLAPGSAGYWRSPSGENHGRDSRPGDVWHEPGDITDTDRLDWLEKYGPTWSRAAIDAAMARQRNNAEIAYMMGARPNNEDQTAAESDSRKEI